MNIFTKQLYRMSKKKIKAQATKGDDLHNLGKGVDPAWQWEETTWPVTPKEATKAPTDEDEVMEAVGLTEEEVMEEEAVAPTGIEMLEKELEKDLDEVTERYKEITKAEYNFANKGIEAAYKNYYDSPPPRPKARRRPEVKISKPKLGRPPSDMDFYYGIGGFDNNPNKYDEMRDLKRLFTTVIYSKEELFFLLRIAEKAGINTDSIDPHTFPIAEVLLGEKTVYIPYNPKEKLLEIHVLPTGTTENFLYDVVTLPDFMRTLGVESPREHILANFVSRKSKANSQNTIDINGVSYHKDVVEQMLDCSFDDFIANLEYESKMTYE